MKKINIFILLLLSLSIFLSVFPSKEVNAKPIQFQITTPTQLIEAVNNLRVSYGLAPLTSHPILMQSAQSQADYMAATGNVTHTRPGGITYTQQLLSLGFPLAGDLSLGGFRAENILYSSGFLDWNGVPPGWQDDAHMNTMLSQNFTHIGAGISQSGGAYYYAVDTAASTSNGQMQSTAPQILEGSSGTSGEAAGVSQFMVPITLSTADAQGRVFHKVQYGQTLWSIAIAYGTTIKNIQALNNLGEDLTIYQGQDLLVLQGVTPSAPPTSEATATPAVSPTIPSTVTQPATLEPTQSIVTATLEEIEANTSNPANSRLLVILLIVAAFVGAGMAVWVIRDPNN
ncbi:MAG: LysM peptidoglycan-binding domain-containing protein [Anaerolineales bacterium]|nr:LysM peptidoglycan-binding domain-containing protein [Anaerolineales bacterium]